MFIQIAANFTVSKQIDLFFGFTIPIGSLLYALSFTWIDLVNEYLGKEKARFLVVISIIANIFMILWLELYIKFPGTKFWESNSFNQQAIEFVFGGYWRVYIASLFTFFVVENTDITIYHYFKANKPSIPKWLRSFASNTVSAPFDAILFATLAFTFVIPYSQILQIILGSIIYKLFVSYFSIPLLYIIHSQKINSENDNTE